MSALNRMSALKTISRPAVLLKYLGYGLAGLLLAALLLLSVLLLSFNPNDYKQQIVNWAWDKTGRNLSLDGDIKLTVWPQLGVDLGAASLSKQGNQQPFASVTHVQLSLAWLPLLKKEWVVGTVYLDGLNARLIQHADGSTNFADLFDGDTKPTFSYAIDGLIVKNSRLDYLNEASNSRIQLSNLSIKTGRIAQDQAVDLAANFKLDAQAAKLISQVKLQTRLLYQSTAPSLLAEHLRLSMQGQLAQAKLDALVSAEHVSANSHGLSAPLIKANVSLAHAPHAIKTRWQLSALSAHADAVNIGQANADLSYVNGKRLLTSHFNTPISVQWPAANVSLSQLSGQMRWQDKALKSAGLKADIKLTAQANLKHGTGQSRFHFASGSGQLNGDIEFSHVTGAKFKFNLAAENWDLNTYLASPTKTETTQASPVDLSLLTGLQLDGQLKLANIDYAPYQLHTLQARLLSDGKTLRAKGLRLHLDDSQIRGDVAVTLQASPAYKVNLAIDTLDLNRYQTSDKNKPANKAHSAKADWDLADLKHYNASGDIRISQLRLGDKLAKQVHISLQGQP